VICAETELSAERTNIANARGSDNILSFIFEDLGEFSWSYTGLGRVGEV
jgi:hypothetical protein